MSSQIPQLKGLSATEVDTFVDGIRANIAGEQSAVDLAKYVPMATMLLQSREAEIAKKVAAAGVRALAAAADEDGAMKTPGGAVLLVEKEGSGAKPGQTDTVIVHYEGRLVDGTVFDSSYQRGEPLEFALNGVIAGW